MVPFTLLATASHAAFEMSSTGSIKTWFLTPTRPFSLRKPLNVIFEYFDAIFLSLPAFGFAIMCVNMSAFGDVSNYFTNIFSIFNCCITVL